MFFDNRAWESRAMNPKFIPNPSTDADLAVSRLNGRYVSGLMNAAPKTQAASRHS